MEVLRDPNRLHHGPCGQFCLLSSPGSLLLHDEMRHRATWKCAASLIKNTLTGYKLSSLNFFFFCSKCSSNMMLDSKTLCLCNFFFFLKLGLSVPSPSKCSDRHCKFKVRALLHRGSLFQDQWENSFVVMFLSLYHPTQQQCEKQRVNLWHPVRPYFHF